MAPCQRHGAGQRPAHRRHTSEKGHQPLRRRRVERPRRQNAVRELSRSARSEAGRVARPEPPSGAKRPLCIYASNHGGRESIKRNGLDTPGGAHRDLDRWGADAQRCRHQYRLFSGLAQSRGAHRPGRLSRTRRGQDTGAIFLDAGHAARPGCRPPPTTHPDRPDFTLFSSRLTKRPRGVRATTRAPLRTAQLKEFVRQYPLDATPPDYARMVDNETRAGP